MWRESINLYWSTCKENWINLYILSYVSMLGGNEMRFLVKITREDNGAKVYINEDDLETMFTKDAQIIILKAYAQAIEESKKND